MPDGPNKLFDFSHRIDRQESSVDMEMAVKSIYYLTIGFGAFFLLIENIRRGVSYFEINATTMIEDYLMGVIFISAALIYRKNRELGTKLIIGAWAYAVGGMFVPFAAHLEAFLRGETFRPDHIHTDVNSIVLKGFVWLLAILILTWAIKERKTLEES